MKNCIIAQSGGPTSAINASVIGMYERNNETKYFDKVYFGINGIEGILNKKIIDTSSMNEDIILNLKNTPSSSLGSCRYKLEDYNINSIDYDKVIDILTGLDIDTFFYVGGNDSMDTILKFSKYCENTSCKIKFIGIPKTIDNDLLVTDHCPGFGSAAKFISTVVLETYLDSSVYKNNGIFILETMGRDTGWLAASAILSKIDDKNVVDLIYLPEKPMNIEKFLKDVAKLYEEKNKVYIVVSEGIKTQNGKFISEQETLVHDKFGHAQLGGVANTLKALIIEANITSRVKTIELGVLQRCAMHCASNRDIEESNSLGSHALELSRKGYSGVMAVIKRTNNSPYKYEITHEDISNIANKTKYFPTDWINEDGNFIKEEAINYLLPLIEGNPTLKYENNLPKFNFIY